MKRFIEGPLPEHARNLMRKVGYGEHRGHRGQTSFTRRLTSEAFPRYHAYVEEQNGGLQINIHLDQQKHTVDASAHKGEYSGPLISQELDRIHRNITALREEGGMASSQSSEITTTDKESESKFW